MEELRLRYKREAQKKIKKLERQFKAKLKRNAYQRKWRCKKHPKKYRGKRRGPEPMHLNSEGARIFSKMIANDISELL